MRNEESIVKGGMNGVLSLFLIKQRVKMIAPFLSNKEKILDIGCGLFKFDGLLPKDCSYMGIDIEEEIIHHNRCTYPYRFLQLDVEKDTLKVCGSDFTLVLMLAVAEHFRDLRRVLEKIAGIMSPGGKIVLTTPHPKGEFLMAAGAKLKLFAQDKHAHFHLFDYQKLRKLAADSGFEAKNYKKFLGGLNQLIIFTRRKSG